MKDLKDPPKVKGLIFSKEEIAEAKNKHPGEHGSLLNVTLELPCDCNLRCPYCFTNFGERKGSELNMERIDALLKECSSLGVRSIVIDGSGEPIMNWQFTRSVLEKINDHGMSPVVFTNSIFITSKIAEWLYDNNVTVIAKLNSLDPKVQDELTGIDNSSKQMRRGIDFLIKSGLADDNRLAIQNTITTLNYKTIPELWTWVREKGIIPFFETFSCVGKAGENRHLQPEADDLKDLFFELLMIDETRFGYTWTPSIPYVGSNCNRCYYTAHVDSEGNVKLCPLLPPAIGSIYEKGFGQIIKDERFDHMKNIDRHIKESDNKCSRCELIGTCYGCRSRAFLASKKTDEKERLSDEDPLCWRGEQ